MTRMRTGRQALLALGAAALTATAAFAHPKVTREILLRFWPNAQTAAPRQINLSKAQEQAIVKVLGRSVPTELDHTAYFDVKNKNGALLGMLMNFDPPGVGMGLAVDPSRTKIVKAVIYKQRPEVPKLDVGDFLAQFAGKTARDPFKVGQDIKPVPGAEALSQTVAADIKAALLLARNGFSTTLKPELLRQDGHAAHSASPEGSAPHGPH